MIEIKDNGYLKIVHVDADDKRTELKVDYYSLYNRMVEACASLVDAEGNASTDVQNAAIVGVLESAGFKGVSHEWADSLYWKLKEMIDERKKKGRTSPTAAGAESSDSESPVLNL